MDTRTSRVDLLHPRCGSQIGSSKELEGRSPVKTLCLAQGSIVSTCSPSQHLPHTSTHTHTSTHIQTPPTISYHHLPSMEIPSLNSQPARDIRDQRPLVKHFGSVTPGATSFSATPSASSQTSRSKMSSGSFALLCPTVKQFFVKQNLMFTELHFA